MRTTDAVDLQHRLPCLTLPSRIPTRTECYLRIGRTRINWHSRQPPPPITIVDGRPQWLIHQLTLRLRRHLWSTRRVVSRISNQPAGRQSRHGIVCRTLIFSRLRPRNAAIEEPTNTKVPGSGAVAVGTKGRKVGIPPPEGTVRPPLNPLLPAPPVLASQPILMTFMSSVTAPVSANALPHPIVALVLRPTLARARIFP